MNEFLQLLIEYRAKIDAVSGDVTPPEFSMLFSEGVELFSLTDETVAELFSASRPTANRWRNGVSAPALAMRKLVLGKLRERADRRIRSLERRKTQAPPFEQANNRLLARTGS